MSQYQIQEDGSVTLDGKIVGHLTTGEDGFAYVEFDEGFAPEKGQHWFSGYFPFKQTV